MIAFEEYRSDLHQQWKQDRELRLRVPLRDAWRGCLCLAALIADQDDTQYHGDLAFVRNEQLRWVAMRDVPVGRFPGCPSMDRRDVTYVNAAVAQLRHGLPVIDFTHDLRDAVDFRFFPFGVHVERTEGGQERRRTLAVGDVLNSDERPREFAVFNRMSQQMTRFAFAGLDHRCRPIRNPYFRLRPEWMEPFSVPAPRQFMPRPYLAYPREAVERLFWLATRSEPRGSGFECPSCRHVIAAKAFAEPGCRSRFFACGDFVAHCPRCRRRRKWFVDDARPYRVRRQFPAAFQAAFCRAAADEGLPLCSVGPSVYRGTVSVRPEEKIGDYGRDLDLVAHRFQSTLDGRSYLVHLPRQAKVLAKPGQALEAGEVWCHALPAPPKWWQRMNSGDQWCSRANACGGHGMTDLLQRSWFEHQAVRLESDTGLVLFPSQLVAYAVRELRPAGLWWDLSPCEPYVDSFMEAVVLPPLRVHEWDRLQFVLPGDVRVDASIADPRLDRNGGEAQRPAHARNRGRSSDSVPRARSAKRRRTAPHAGCGVR